MKTIFKSFVFAISSLNLFFCFQVYAVPYDYSYTLGCVATPEPPQYNGGMVVNPEFNDELKGWAASGNAEIAIATSADGNSYAVVSSILTPLSDGLSLALAVEKDKLYSVSAWFSGAEAGEGAVQVKIVTSTGNQTANWITARGGCWTMLKGGFSVNVTKLADLHFETSTTGFDMWVDGISVQPFTQHTSHQLLSLETVRKARVKFEVMDESGKPVADAAVTIKQREPYFPFGCAMNGLIVENQKYRDWFLNKRFKYSVFENELKWEFTEKTEGTEDYSVPDKMLEFAQQNNISVRGHNILWEDRQYMPDWQKTLAPEKLRKAAVRRVRSVVRKYKGQFIHWDVINENMHYDTFSNLTNNGSDVFRLVTQLDPAPLPFLNEFNVVEDCKINAFANPWSYLKKIEQIRAAAYDGPLGIGLEGHFNLDPNMAFIRASIDMLKATGLPIWLTEFDVDSNRNPSMIKYINLLLRELHSHPYVSGIMLWAALNESCFKMCLTDTDYNNLPAGDAIDEFMTDFITVKDTHGETDPTGVYQASLFHGEYEAAVTLPDGAHSPAPQSFNILPCGDGDATLIINFIVPSL